ncbi:hypothetical protein VRRI112168_10790 [Vreelandella rituensis]|uniref:Uncharacterized protein n=1 Tax=Vreelandella rituensis TaxID=2282306 RepID=A0A368U2I1_9GAMM|nr:hypothetical protein [Halomonas rituensis]RCV90302.1 hypothetical protein DU506_11850 [Halomonas rituensis]
MKNQIRIAAAAVALVQAERAVDEAKEEYSFTLTNYFSKHGRPDGRMTADDPRFESARRATEPRYQELQRLKRRFYRARQKLRLEVGRAGGGLCS